MSGEILIVSRFYTARPHAKGNRPSYIDAAKPIFQSLCTKNSVLKWRFCSEKVKTGEFGADMKVTLINDLSCNLLTVKIRNKMNKGLKVFVWISVFIVLTNTFNIFIYKLPIEFYSDFLQLISIVFITRFAHFYRFYFIFIFL